MIFLPQSDNMLNYYLDFSDDQFSLSSCDKSHMLVIHFLNTLSYSFN